MNVTERERERERSREREGYREGEVPERRWAYYLCTILSATTADGSNTMYNVHVHVLYYMLHQTSIHIIHDIVHNNYDY